MKSPWKIMYENSKNAIYSEIFNYNSIEDYIKNNNSALVLILDSVEFFLIEYALNMIIENELPPTVIDLYFNKIVSIATFENKNCSNAALEIVKKNIYKIKEIFDGWNKWDLDALLFLISENKLPSSVIDLYFDEIVEKAVLGDETLYAPIAIEILTNLDKEKYLKKIVDLTYFYIETNKYDCVIFLLSTNLFYRLGDKDIFIEFINKYPKELEEQFGDNSIIEDMLKNLN